jgi:hypothetical protein
MAPDVEQDRRGNWSCPQSGNAGLHSAAFYDDGSCAWCGAEPWPELQSVTGTIGGSPYHPPGGSDPIDPREPEVTGCCGVELDESGVCACDAGTYD